jgi:hypothetical protein
MKNVAKNAKDRVIIKSLRGNELIIEWVNNVTLFSSYEEKVHYIEAWEVIPQKGGSTKSQYYGKWITDIEITKNNA